MLYINIYVYIESFSRSKGTEEHHKQLTSSYKSQQVPQGQVQQEATKKEKSENKKGTTSTFRYGCGLVKCLQK